MIIDKDTTNWVDFLAELDAEVKYGDQQEQQELHIWRLSLVLYMDCERIINTNGCLHVWIMLCMVVNFYILLCFVWLHAGSVDPFLPHTAVKGILVPSLILSLLSTKECILYYLKCPRANITACSLGLSATSQQYFSLRTNQPSATSQPNGLLESDQQQRFK
jgi:hypothetical protein